MRAFLLYCCLMLGFSSALAQDVLTDQKGKKQSLSALRADIVVINFWATWCPHCLKEIPALSHFLRTQKKRNRNQKYDAQIIGVAVDNAENVAQFLKKNPVSYPIWLFKGDSIGFMQEWGNATGGLPYTVVVAKKCAFRQPILGVVGEKELDLALKEARHACEKTKP